MMFSACAGRRTRLRIAATWLWARDLAAGYARPTALRPAAVC
jgi:hypothetical protein